MYYIKKTLGICVVRSTVHSSQLVGAYRQQHRYRSLLNANGFIVVGTRTQRVPFCRSSILARECYGCAHPNSKPKQNCHHFVIERQSLVRLVRENIVQTLHFYSTFFKANFLKTLKKVLSRNFFVSIIITPSFYHKKNLTSINKINQFKIHHLQKIWLLLTCFIGHKYFDATWTLYAHFLQKLFFFWYFFSTFASTRYEDNTEDDHSNRSI